ncbi:MAG: hypothetical protein KC621_00710 [Myxococcales bacterium]|nr:hypothetical protein [Myxococcales bacterium]
MLGRALDLEGASVWRVLRQKNASRAVRAYCVSEFVRRRKKVSSASDARDILSCVDPKGELLVEHMPGLDVEKEKKFFKQLEKAVSSSVYKALVEAAGGAVETLADRPSCRRSTLWSATT